MAPSAAQLASGSVGGQPHSQQTGVTSGEALDAPASRTKLASGSTHGPVGIEPATGQPASESVGGQPAGQRPVEASREALGALAQQTKLAEIGAAFAGDQATLRNYLRDPDPIIGAAAFDALGVRNKRAALEALLEVVNDPTEPLRLQALQLLLDTPEVDEATLTATLRAALEDPDPAFVARAVQEFGGRTDAEALSALAEALDAGDLPTRLLIVQSIASNTSDVPLLYRSLKDPDETVRSAATEILFPSKTSNTESAASR
jgi:HEAT repeat protein